MNVQGFDIVVIGAGIAGATTAAALARDHRVALIEAEEQPGYHTTGRSAARWERHYGPPDVRLLTALSRPFFEMPPSGFSEIPLMRLRPTVVLARNTQRAELAQALADGPGRRPLAEEELRRILPALRPDYGATALIEDDCFDLDVAAIHQGFLRQFRGRGGVLGLRRRAGRIELRGAAWRVETSAGDLFQAPVVVNAAGAWGDEIAQNAGVRPLGLSPRRRTGVIIDPAPWDVAEWPMLMDVAESWYTRPEARTKLMVSPADATPMHAHDVQADELDIALAIDRMQQALDIKVHRVERSWAGLRTFTPDGSLAFGWDDAAPGFFWCVGQGGYGIQTSPAAGNLVADLIGDRAPGSAGAILPAIDPRRLTRGG